MKAIARAPVADRRRQRGGPGLPNPANGAANRGDGRLQEMTAALRARGRRITPQRLAILKILARSAAHPDAGRIHRAVRAHFPAASLATVYKTLGALREAAQVLELEFSGLANRYDGRRPDPHPHVICEICGRIVDPEAVDVARIIAAMCWETGFSIRGSRLDFFGACPACRRKRRG